MGRRWGRVLYLEESASEEYGWWWVVCGRCFLVFVSSGEGDVGASFEVGAVPFGKRVVQWEGRGASREILLLVCRVVARARQMGTS
jgi:hypothetical protein